MKIVTDGKKYALRKGWWNYKYLDLESPGFWWTKDSRYFLACWGDLEEVMTWYNKLNPKVVMLA